MKRTSSIINRIIGQHLLALVATAIVILGGAYFLLNSTVNIYERQILRDHAVVIAKYLTFEDGRWSISLPEDLRTFYERGDSGYGLEISDDSGKALYSSLPESSPTPEGAPGQEATFRQARLGDSLYYLLVLPVKAGRHTARITVGQNSANPEVIVDDVLARFLRRIAWIVLPIFGLLLFLDVILVRNILRPVLQASKIAANISSSQLSDRLPEDELPLEIRPLASAVNAALGRLELALKAQREFTADAAHELRTPLTILRTHIDTKLEIDAAKELRADVDSAIRILDQLLELAEMEGGWAGRWANTDVNRATSELVALNAPIAIAENKNLEFVPSPDAPVQYCNWDMVSRALTNLIDNAMRYTPEGGAVTVAVVAPNIIEVLDRGPGIKPDHREFIFRRFWRKNRQDRGHAGLGLAIVAKIAQLHGGSITVSDRPGGGSIFRLSLGPVPSQARRNTVGT